MFNPPTLEDLQETRRANEKLVLKALDSKSEWVETELAKTTGLALSHLRSALASLLDQGRVRRLPGTGTRAVYGLADPGLADVPATPLTEDAIRIREHLEGRADTAFNMGNELRLSREEVIAAVSLLNAHKMIICSFVGSLVIFRLRGKQDQETENKEKGSKEKAGKEKAAKAITKKVAKEKTTKEKAAKTTKKPAAKKASSKTTNKADTADKTDKPAAKEVKKTSKAKPVVEKAEKPTAQAKAKKAPAKATAKAKATKTAKAAGTTDKANKAEAKAEAKKPAAKKSAAKKTTATAKAKAKKVPAKATAKKSKKFATAPKDILED